MATVKIVSKEHWDILQEYLAVPCGGVVLIPEDILNTLPEEQKNFLQENDGGYIDYDFGGDADLWVDSVVTKEHNFFSCVFPEPNDFETANAEQERSIEVGIHWA